MWLVKFCLIILGLVVMSCFANDDCAHISDETVSAKFHRLLQESDESDFLLYKKFSQLGANITDEWRWNRIKSTELFIRKLAEFDEGKLNSIDKINYEVMQWTLNIRVKESSMQILPVINALPVDIMAGEQVTFLAEAVQRSGQSQMRTSDDYEAILQKNHEYAVWLGQVHSRLQQGLLSGVTMPKAMTLKFVEQLNAQLVQDAEKSYFYFPIINMPPGISDIEKRSFQQRIYAGINNEINPNLIQLLSFLKTDYLPKSTSEIGLIDVKGGANLYRFLIEQYTTKNLSADDIHKVGLSEVSRIKKEMLKIVKQVKYKGSLAEFFQSYRTEKSFKFESNAEIFDLFGSIHQQVERNLSKLFFAVEDAPLEIRPMDEIRARSDALARYAPSLRGAQLVGSLFINTYNATSHSKYECEAIYLHEAIPGHHFQFSFSQQSSSVPQYLKSKPNDAYVEGWALYSESLALDLGLNSQPYEHFGSLNLEMLRALRLVVDSGIHAKGWSRSRAIKYLMENSAVSETTANEEVDRYISNPGQVLSYKIGELSIKGLKAKAMQVMADRFDIRVFHEKILESGAIPLPVLEKKVNAWIDSQR